MLTLLKLRCAHCKREVENPLVWRAGTNCAQCGKPFVGNYAFVPSAVMSTSAAIVSDEEALKQVWLQLTGHSKTVLRHTPVDTLNRLFSEAFSRRSENTSTEPPTFTADQLTARLQWWSTDNIEKLRRYHNRNVPGSGKASDQIRAALFNMPVVVLRDGGTRHLIDGTNRINRKLAGDAPGPHPVYVVERK